MNREKAQTIINSIVESYRNSSRDGGRSQYPASKKNLKQAEELGILDLIPNAPYSRHIGNTEIQLILKAATDDGQQVGGMIDGEGDVTTTAPSALYQALNEADEPIETQSQMNTTTYVTKYNRSGGFEIDDAAQVIIHEYDEETHAVTFSFTDRGGMFTGIVTARTKFNDDDADLPENWQDFTTIDMDMTDGQIAIDLPDTDGTYDNQIIVTVEDGAVEWCICGYKDGLYSETDDMEADSIASAISNAKAYFEQYHEELSDGNF